MKKYIIFPSLFLLFVLNSCHKEIKAEKGGIDIISNVYFDASKGLNKMQNFHISRLNYQNDSIIELIARNCSTFSLSVVVVSNRIALRCSSCCESIREQILVVLRAIILYPLIPGGLIPPVDVIIVSHIGTNCKVLFYIFFIF
jgi:hypothetical protein